MAFVLKFLFKSLSKKRLPQISGKLILSAIKDKVEILRDKWGIPHIYANSDEDLAFAMGFVHAQDRLWQMELYRRTASGTLSEIFGEVAIDTDRTARTFGFRRLGIVDYNTFSPDVKNALESYAAGVNAYLQHPSTKLPLEFTLIKHVPQPWSPHDSMAFARLMLWQLNGQFSLKISRGQVLKLVGEEKFKELDFGFPGLNPFVVPEGIDCNIYEGGVLRAIKGPFIKKGGGSNSWAVAGNLTTTGKPIHCSDPHLGPSLPSIWHMVHIHNPSYHVYGVCPPVMPMVLIGHNDRISWGFTVANVDAEDLFIEKMNPSNPQQYEFQGKWCDAEVFEEKIMIKGISEPVIEKVIITRHGPIISDVVGNSHERIALSSTALHPSTIVQGIQNLNKAKNWDDFVAAVKLVIGLNQNICYADVEGNIGNYVCGRAPIRAKGDGSIPVPGWSGEYEWTGEIPFEEMPHSLNPTKNYVVCSNNLPVDPKKFKYYLSKFADPGYRARVISEFIEGKPKIAPEDFMSLHMNLKSYPGVEFIKKMESFEKSPEAQNADVQLALKLLKSWDGNFTVDCIGGTVYEVTHNQLLTDIFEPVLNQKLAKAFIGEGFHPLFKNTTEFYHGNTLLLFSLLDRPDSWWIQQAGGLNALLAKSFQNTVKWLRENVNSDPNKWQWGALNKIVYPHAMAMQKPLDKVFNVGPLPMAGNKHTVCQIGSPIGTYAEKAWAPSYRQIVNMADLSKSYVVFPPGQSGNLASPHYRDLFELWYQGKYIPMLWNRDQVEANLEGKLELVPN